VTLLSEIAGRGMRLPAALTRDVDVERDLAAVMDDGVVLLADRYAPRGAGLLPVVLVRTPYGRAGAVGLIYGRLVAERGFQVVVQSVRGTFGSGGRFAPFDERADGLATLRWLQAQPWCAGPIGMIGSSYMGLVQWAVASDPAIGALSPTITASEFHSQAYAGGAIALDTALSWTLIIAAQERRAALVRLALGLRRTLPKLLDELPLGEIDALLAGEELPFYREWFEQTAPDEPYWATRDYSADVGNVRAPVQLIGGWYDIFLPWLLADHAALVAAGRETQLLIGPWAHTSTGLLSSSLREGLAWMRAHLLGDERMLSRAPVRIWVGGEDRWRELDAWPPPGARPLRLHLQPGGGLDAAAPPAGAAPDRYRYDPAHPTPTHGGAHLVQGTHVPQGPVDQTEIDARDDVVTFTTDELADDIEVTGWVEAELWVQSSAPCTDFTVRVSDVHPDGRPYNVCDGIQRVRVASSAEPVPVRIRLGATAQLFGRGHRIRVAVSSSNSPRFDINPNTGESAWDSSDTVTAAQRIHTGTDTPSRIALPVIPS